MEEIVELARWVNHSIPLKGKVKVYCACVRHALLYAAEPWVLIERLKGLLASCNHRVLRYKSKMAGQNY